MGLINFVKSVGAKLGIGDSGPKAEELKQALDGYKLGTDKINVSLDGDTAVLKGEVADRATLEKVILAVGNYLGIASVNTNDIKIAAADAGAGQTTHDDGTPVFYTVKKGDTLWKIAEEIYGKGQGAKNTEIFEANKPMLTSPDKIYPGQVLRIPSNSGQ